MPQKFKPIYINIALFIAGTISGYTLGYFLPLNRLVDLSKREVSVKISEIEKGSKEETLGTNEKQECDFPVEVAGAVMRPGVYCFTQESIVEEALKASGGLNRLAAIRYVSQRVNLAEKLTGNQKIYFPYEDDLKCEKVPFVSDSKVDQYINSNSKSSCVSINSATQKELEGLNGIGEVSARKIIAGRTYSKIEEIKEKAGISEKLFEQISDLVCL